MSNELKETVNVGLVNTEPTFLAEKNEHGRDKDMQFVESTHKYTIITDPDSKYDSVTTWNHSHFAHFNATLIIKNMMKGQNWNPDNKSHVGLSEFIIGTNKTVYINRIVTTQDYLSK